MFALAKSIYLLKAQYREQLFNLTSSKIFSKQDTEWKIARQKFLSRYSIKKETSQILTESIRFEIPEKLDLTIDICVPVYNRFDLAEILMKQIKNQIDTLTKKYLWRFNVIVADDKSNSRTNLALKNLCSELGFSLIVQDENLGVVGNVNSAFSKSSSDLFLLFNSDAQLIDNTILSMIKPFLQLEKIGLVTAPNFDLFDRFMEVTSDWQTVGDFLASSSQDSINYVAACTAVSYAIGIRRCAVEMDQLMDPEFGMGYGEDSDLHYQLVSRGWQSVWTLDTLVSHYGGASFGQDAKAISHRAHGRKVFFERWGKLYFSEIEAHEVVLENCIINRMKYFKELQSECTLIITPSDKRNIGGLSVANQLIRLEISKEQQVKLLVLDEYYPRNYDDILRTTTIPVHWSSFNKIIFIGIGSIRWFVKQKLELSGYKFAFFLQGPDWVIEPSGIQELEFLEQNVEKYFAE
jgi:GT2 family glycosyltransferase